MIQTLTLSGDIPSKKNSKRIVYHGHKPAIISSKAHEEWHTLACFELRRQRVGEKLPLHPKLVDITIWPKTKRRSDLTNKAESIMDLLVDNGILKDDNWFEVSHIVLNFGGVDRKYPHAEIKITTK